VNTRIYMRAASTLVHRLGFYAAAHRLRLSSAAGDGGLSLSDAGALLASSECRKVIVMTGAGVSVSAGIPDFRTPGTGLYDNLQEYGLPYAEAIFDLDFFRANPAPFYRLCKELWPGRYAPTPTHRFIRLLEQQGKLQRCFTQNIDSLESAAGLSAERLVAAHGNFDSARVVGGGPAVDPEEVRAAVNEGEEGWRQLNAKHGGLVKPDIVFFGEQLPMRFFECARSDFPKCDLLLVMGTSLVVQPFAGLVNAVRPGTPRLLVNREPVWGWSQRGTDGFFQGDSDAAVAELASAAGWKSEFEALINSDAS